MGNHFTQASRRELTSTRNQKIKAKLEAREIHLGSIDGIGGDEFLDIGVGPGRKRIIAPQNLLEVVEEGEIPLPVLLHLFNMFLHALRHFDPPYSSSSAASTSIFNYQID